MKAKHRASGRARGGICKLKKTKDCENGEWIVDSALCIPKEAATLRVVAGADVHAHLDFTPTVFWPMIRELSGIGRGRITEGDAQVLHTVRRWIIFDWLRVLAIAVAFLSSVRAISVPFPGARGAAAAWSNVRHGVRGDNWP